MPSTPSTPHLSFDDVSLSYPVHGRPSAASRAEGRGDALDGEGGVGAGALLALSGLSFAVEAGQSVAVIGPSGCGKSSTLQLAAGLAAASSGHVEVDGAPVTAPRKKTALILQDFGLLPWKTARKNVELGLKLRGVAAGERRERADAALADVGLSDFADSYPDALSGGMRQRLALARSLALDADLLLMDEPLSALDALLREQMQELLLGLWRHRGYAQVLVTHSIDEAVFLGQRVFVMSGRPGHIVAALDNPEAGGEGWRESRAFFERARELRALLREGGGRDA